MGKEVVLSGMRPTGKLHLGHWVGALSNWIKLQEEYKCFFMVADWHALMSEYKNSAKIKESIFDNVCTWIAYGIDPDKSVVFVQSDVKEHLELFIILSVFTPLGWLSRCPTFKEQIKQLKEKEINTYAFLGYPVLQSADIFLYKAKYVPVGEDQLPHLELSREIGRRFNTLYNKDVFIEPQPLLTKLPRLLGLDGRKMSKSYNNYIALDEEDEIIEQKVLSMFTDPKRLRLEDKGHPEICNVHNYYAIFASPQLTKEAYDWCTQAKKGCRECKIILARILKEFIAPKREKKKDFFRNKNYLLDILKEGRENSSNAASVTMRETKEVMGW